MRIITISREFGSGGRELGKRLSDLTGYDYYDSEIIAAVAKNSGLDENYIENTLNSRIWQTQSLTYRATLSSGSYLGTAKISLLLEQKKVIEGIAALGRDCIIVGRNADILLQRYRPFNLFVCAQSDAKLRRCQERAPAGENLSGKELLRKMKQIDKARAQTRQILTGSPWGQRDAYHLTVNTTGRSIKDLASAVAAYTDAWFGGNV